MLKNGPVSSFYDEDVSRFEILDVQKMFLACVLESLAMRYTFVAVWCSGNKPCAWIGPVKNLAPAARRRISAMDRQILLKRQNGTCSCCGERIELHPVASCDADHIVPVARGGETLLENMQLLAVKCHRRKTLNESRKATKIVHIDGDLGGKVYIFSSSAELQSGQFPVDKRTALECVTNGCGLSLLAYKREDRGYVEPLDEVDYRLMLSHFAFRPEN